MGAISHSNLKEEKEIDSENDDEGYKETICDISAHIEDEGEEEDIDIYTNCAVQKQQHHQSGSTLQGIGQKTISLSHDGDDENSMYGEENISIQSPGGAKDEQIYKKPTLRLHKYTEGQDEFKQIEECLKLCDNIEWEEYLQNFKANKVNDKRVNKLQAHDWKELLPAIGVRNEFMELWQKCENRKQQPASK